MAKRRIVYRDYRPGKKGRFTSQASYNRSQASGVKCHIHREYVRVYDITSLDELEEYEDYEDLEYEEFHGTGDT